MNVGPAWLIVVSALGYALAARSARGRHRPPVWRVVAFLAGLGTLGFALSGPLDTLAHTLFWAHMVQHMLLTIIVPPLLALGHPAHLTLGALPLVTRRAVARWLVRPAWPRRALTLVSHPLTLTLALNVPLVVWHLPAIYEAAVANQLLHDLEHVSFMGPAVVLWVVLLEPTVPRHCRLTAEGALLLLFATWMVCDLLGAALTFSSISWYPLYAASAEAWGMSATEDQRLGGLVMWIAGGIFYGVAMLVTFVHMSDVQRDGARSPSRP